MATACTTKLQAERTDAGDSHRWWLVPSCSQPAPSLLPSCSHPPPILLPSSSQSPCARVGHFGSKAAQVYTACLTGCSQERIATVVAPARGLVVPAVAPMVPQAVAAHVRTAPASDTAAGHLAQQLSHVHMHQTVCIITVVEYRTCALIRAVRCSVISSTEHCSMSVRCSSL